MGTTAKQTKKSYDSRPSTAADTRLKKKTVSERLS